MISNPTRALPEFGAHHQQVSIPWNPVGQWQDYRSAHAVGSCGFFFGCDPLPIALPCLLSVLSLTRSGLRVSPVPLLLPQAILTGVLPFAAGAAGCALQVFLLAHLFLLVASTQVFINTVSIAKRASPGKSTPSPLLSSCALCAPK